MNSRRVVELDQKIGLIQRSTRTLFRVFFPVHDWLRLHNTYYYLWSMNKCSRVIHWVALFLFVCSLPALYAPFLFGSLEKPRAEGQPTYDFARWETIFPKPFITPAAKAFCASGSTNFMWTIDSNGFIYRSDDSGSKQLGEEMRQYYTGISTALRDISCYNEANIIVVGNSGVVLKYVDDSWKQISSDAFDSSNVTKVLYLDQNHVIAYADDKIYISSDSGITWRAVDSGISGLTSLVKLSDNSAVGISNNKVTATTDYGATWFYANIPTSTVANLAALDSTHALATTNSLGSTVYKILVNDGEIILSPSTIPVSGNPLSAAGFILALDPMHIYVTGRKDVTFKDYYSNDGGTTWTSLDGDYNSGKQIIKVSDNKIFTFDSFNMTCSFSNFNPNDETWTYDGDCSLPLSADTIENVYGTGQSLMLFTTTSSSISVWLSSDGGESWTQNNSDTAALSGLSGTGSLALSPDYSVIANQYGYYYDHSVSHVAIYRDDTKAIDVFSVASVPGTITFLDNNNAILYGGKNLRYSEGTWSVSDPQSGAIAGTNYRVSDQKAIKFGASNKTYTTQDAGSNWTQTNTTTANRHAIAFDRDHNIADEDTVVTVGTSGAISRSADGGLTWTNLAVPGETKTAETLNVIARNDENNLIAAGNNHVIITSNDGGATWTAQSGENLIDNIESITTTDSNIDGEFGVFAITKREGTGEWITSLYYNSTSGRGAWTLVEDPVITAKLDRHSRNYHGIIDSMSGTQVLLRISDSAPDPYGSVLTGKFSADLSPVPFEWSTIPNIGESPHFLTGRSYGGSQPFAVVADGFGNTLTRYYTPANSTATDLLVKLSNQDDFADLVGVNPLTTTINVKAGETVPVKVYATEKVEEGDNNIYHLDKGNASYTKIITSDPSDAEPTVRLTNNDQCYQVDPPVGSPPCGVGETEIIFHTPGTHTLYARDENGFLANSPVQTVIVSEGDPSMGVLSVKDNATALVAGVSSKLITYTLTDLYGNTTKDSNTRTINITTKSDRGRFRMNDTDPWTNSLRMTLPANQSTLTFYYIDYAEERSTITASSEAKDIEDATLSFTSSIDQINPASDVSPVEIIDGNGTAISSGTCGGTASVKVRLSSGEVYVSGRTLRAYPENVITDNPQITDSNGYAYFSLRQTKSQNVSISIYDETDRVWLQSQPVFVCTPAPISKISLTSKTSGDVTAGTSLNIAAAFYDEFDNLATNSIDKISLISDDGQASLPGEFNLNPTNDKEPGKHSFNGIVLKSAGQRTIIITDKTRGISSSLSFSVYAALPSVSDSLFDTNKNLLIIGQQTADLTIKLFDPYGNPVSGKITKIENDSNLGSLDQSEKTTDDSGQAKYTYTPKKAGRDTLTAFMPDNDDPSKNTAFSTTIIIENKEDTAVNQVASLVDTLQNSPTAQKIADVAKKVVQTTAALGMIPLIANIVGSAPAALHAVNYGISITLEALGLRRKRRSWGRVYDSTTGKGIDLAIVRLYDQDTMKLKGTIITDIKGKYHFAIEPGIYVISVSKEGFVFPTSIFAEYGIEKISKNASRVNNHYVGQPINISSNYTNLNIEIPIDPVRKKATIFLRLKIFASDLLGLLTFGLSNIVIPLLILGSLMSLFTAVVVPENKNIILAAIYVALTLSYIISRMLKSSHTSTVIDRETGKPIAGVVVSVFDAKHDTLRETRITDKFGRFSIYAKAGTYYLKAQKEGYNFSGEIIKKSHKTNTDKNHSSKSHRDQINYVLKSADFIKVRITGKKKG